MNAQNLASIIGGAWGTACFVVPRHLFIPDMAWVTPMTGESYWVNKHVDSDKWWEAVYSDSSIVTQINDGNIELTEETIKEASAYTSSCSAPSMVFDFLGLLNVTPGNNVLEIGTGTGWTAGLISHCAGEANVTSVEIDARVSAQATANLDRAGISTRLVVGDGSLGEKHNAPYDRVHVTCGVTRVPYSWLEQTRQGGLIVLPWMHGFSGGQKVRLVVEDQSASGRFRGETAYMLLRSQRPKYRLPPGEDRISTDSFSPQSILRAGEGFSIAMAGIIPGAEGSIVAHDDGSIRAVIRKDDSHALAVREPGKKRSRVTQRGSRSLWDEMKGAYERWVSWGSPRPERFGVTVNADGQHIWLDSTENQIST